MSKLIPITLLTGLLALLPLVGNAQVCKTDSIPATTPNSQLTDNGNGTVTDSKTRLMWKQCSEGLSGTGCVAGVAQTFSWQGALQQAQIVNNSGGFAGFTDWRLPNIKELSSITENQCYAPAINLTHFPNTPSSYFWSASPNVDYGDSAWGVGFNDGDDSWDNKDSAFQVRLVRSGQ